MSNIVLGIDFGTHNSTACICRNGKLDVVSGYGGKSYSRSMPSCVAFAEDGELLVGEPARKQFIKNPENTICGIKRHIGNKNYKVNIQGKQYTPQVISALILRKIKETAENFICEEITDAVITVPAYFDNNQRVAMRDAGRLAGFNVKRLIPEPIAACLAYGLDKQTEDDLNILVFDMGRGTLDVTILEYGGTVFEVQSTSGDTQLGGGDIDNAIMHYIVEEFKKEYGIDLFEDEKNKRILKKVAKEAKKELSTAIETEIYVPFITTKNNESLDLDIALNKSKLEQLVKPILDKCSETIQRALDDAVLTSNDVDKIILVGEDTRMPIVRKYVEEYIGMPAEGGIDPMECVCQGASIQGLLVNEYKELPPDTVIPLSLGIEAEDGSTSVIIKRNTPIPFTKSVNYTTSYDNQTSIVIKVVQGERIMAVDNKELGSLIIYGIPPAPKGVAQIEVIFEIDPYGILNVSTIEKSSGRKQSISIDGAVTIDVDEMERIINECKEFEERDNQKHILAKAKNKAENTIYYAENVLNSSSYGNKLTDSDKQKIVELINKLRLAITNKNVLELMFYTKEVNSIISKVDKTLVSTLNNNKIALKGMEK